MFDNYIFDSQFLFLEEQNLLQQNYYDLALKSCKEESLNSLLFFHKNEEWDSTKFNKKFGRLYWLKNNIENESQIIEINSALKAYDCCYIRLNANHSFCNQFLKINRLPLSKKLSQHISLKDRLLSYNSSIEYNEFVNLPANANILEKVLQLSKNSFRYNRFREDSFFQSDVIDSIYSSWIINEVKNETSKLYYITEGDKVASFFLYKENISPLKKYKIGFVGLITSSPDFREKNYATNLLNFVLEKARQNKTDYVIANTECKNITALNFFKKNNFLETATLNEYHIWN